MASIKRRGGKGGIWYLVWYEGGRRRYQSLRTRDERVAQSKRRAKELELESRGTLLGYTATVGEMAESYLATARTRLRPSSIERAEQILRRPLALWSERRADTITTADVAAFLRGLVEAGAAPGNHNRHRTILSALWRHGVEHGMVRVNVVSPTHTIPVEETTPPFLSIAELDALLSAAERHTMQVAIALMALAGLRLGEAERLTWQDVDLPGKVLTVRGPTKTRRVRVVPLSARLIAILEPRRRASGRVWRKRADAKHDRQINAGRYLVILARRAGIERHVWPHLLRHTFASHLAMAGVSIWKISRWLGHSSVQMTMRYAHLAPQHDPDIDAVARGHDVEIDRMGSSRQP